MWGGLSAIDRKKADRARYDRAVVAAEGFSDRVDDHIVKERIDPWEQGEARRWASWDDVWERGPGERDVRV